jgi:nitroreductase
LESASQSDGPLKRDGRDVNQSKEYTMEFHQAVNKRRTVREFKKDPVLAEAVTRALEAGLRGTGVRFSLIFPGYVREVGMFARFGMTAPWIVGSCSPRQVAAAVVRTLERGSREKIVNFPPLRYAFVINEISPTLGDGLMRLSGVNDFQRRKVGGHADG